ncbi:MAG: VanZ family protein [Lachnospiraceae bacterium]|nr:VanZ family protein [Lachnospiraceae bacterium]
MRISDIISIAKSYLIFGIIIAVFLVAVFLFIYFVVYKKAMKGKRTLSKRKLCWGIIFVCYIFVVLGATLLSRGDFYRNRTIVPLLYSYKEAWMNFSVREWRNLILNIFMFVPFGFLMPLGIKYFQSFWRVYLSGFLFALGIELVQLLLNMGIFECDDILNNVLGTMIGYGFFAIWAFMVAVIRKQSKSVCSVILSQIPLILIVTSFISLFIVYMNQELGNLSCRYVVKIDSDILQVETKETYKNNAASMPVYKVKKASVEETKEFASKFLVNLEDTIDESRTDLYDETAVYYGNKDYSLWIDYRGMTYQFTDFSTLFPDKVIKKEENAEEQTIRSLLHKYMVEVPEKAVFEKKGDGKYSFAIQQCVKDNIMYDGTIRCEYYDNGKFGTINSNLLSCVYEKEYPAISEQEAYQTICEGKFRHNIDSESLDVKVGKAVLDYEVDSKGYYQPIYRFEAEINGVKEQIEIPAYSF